MRTLLSMDFIALLAWAGVSQAAFARLTGITTRQVNNWARGHVAVPRWAILLAVVLGGYSAETLTMMLEEGHVGRHLRGPAGRRTRRSQTW